MMPILQRVNLHSFKTFIGFHLLLAASMAGLIFLFSEKSYIAIFSSLLIKEIFNFAVIMLLLTAYFIFRNLGDSDASNARVKLFKLINMALLGFLTLFTAAGYYTHHIPEQVRYWHINIQQMSEQVRRSQFRFEGNISQAISKGLKTAPKPYTKKESWAVDLKTGQKIRLSCELRGGDCYKIVNDQLNHHIHSVDYYSYSFDQEQVNLIFNIITQEGEIIVFKEHYQRFKILNGANVFVFIFMSIMYWIYALLICFKQPKACFIQREI